jgi:glycosyltransferase involved in cell wall biosynthesis
MISLELLPLANLSLRVVYPFENNHLNPAEQSGRPYQVRAALAAAGVDIVDVPDTAKGLLLPFLPVKVAMRLQNKTWRADRHPWVLDRQARIVAAAFASSGADAVIAPSTLPIASLPPSIPTFIVADAFFHYACNRYNGFSKLSKAYRHNGETSEARALGQIEGFVVPTPDVANALDRAGLIAMHKVRVVSWGPNFKPPASAIDAAAIRRRHGDRRLLFIGREWQRKGFDLVCAALRSLPDVTLTVIGLTADDVPAALYTGIADRIRFLGRLNVSIPDEREQMHAAFAAAALLFVPTRAENFGITFIEALGYGLPILALDVDGLKATLGGPPVATLLPADSHGDAFVAPISSLLGDLGLYVSASTSALAAAHAHSWDNVAQALLDLVAQSRNSGLMARR